MTEHTLIWTAMRDWTYYDAELVTWRKQFRIRWAKVPLWTTRALRSYEGGLIFCVAAGLRQANETVWADY